MFGFFCLFTHKFQLFRVKELKGEPISSESYMEGFQNTNPSREDDTEGDHIEDQDALDVRDFNEPYQSKSPRAVRDRLSEEAIDHTNSPRTKANLESYSKGTHPGRLSTFEDSKTRTGSESQFIDDIQSYFNEFSVQETLFLQNVHEFVSTESTSLARLNETLKIKLLNKKELQRHLKQLDQELSNNKELIDSFSKKIQFLYDKLSLWHE